MLWRRQAAMVTVTSMSTELTRGVTETPRRRWRPTPTALALGRHMRHFWQTRRCWWRQVEASGQRIWKAEHGGDRLAGGRGHERSRCLLLFSAPAPAASLPAEPWRSCQVFAATFHHHEQPA